VLERELERREREPARRQHERDEDEIGPPAHRLLRRDVGGRIRDPRRAREADPRRQAEEGDGGYDGRDREPQRQREGFAGASSRAAHEREPEQHEAGDGGRRSRPLRPAQTSAGECEHDHSARRRGLDERERGEPQSDDVRGPSGEAQGDAGEPDPPAHEGAGRTHRTPE
jgi:hypothetical protein